MKDPLKILRPVLAFFLAGLSSVAAQDQADPTTPTGGEKRPNWFPSLAQFGAYGSSPGQFLAPRSVALDNDRHLFVADTGNHRIQVFTIEGSPLRAWGRPGSEAGEFIYPVGVALSPSNEVFVLDAGNRRVQVFTPEGRFLREWKVEGLRRFRLDLGATIAASRDRVLVANPLVPGIQVFSLNGKAQVTLRAGGEASTLRGPSGLAIDPEGHIYVADAGDHRIRKIDLAGRELAAWGGWGPRPGFFATPRGLAFARGRLFVCDSGNHRVQVFGPSGEFLSQWGGPIRWPGDGQGLLHSPSGIAVGSSGDRAILCEPLEHRCQVFALDTPHEYRPVSGSWLNSSPEHFHGSDTARARVAPSSAAAGPSGVYVGILDQDASALVVYDLASRSPFPVVRTGKPGKRLAEFSLASSVTEDGSGNRYYVLDAGNRRIQAFEIGPQSDKSPSAPAVLKALGALTPVREADAHDAGVDAVCLDAKGNVWTLDAGNAAVFKFDPNGRRTADLRLRGGCPEEDCIVAGMAVSPDGRRIYVLDQFRSRVLAYQEDGELSFSWGGRGTADEMCFLCPSGIAVDRGGFVYVVDSGVHGVRKFDRDGKLVRRWGRYGSKAGEFSSPQGIWPVGRDRLIVDDAGNYRGQVFTLEGAFVRQLHKGAHAESP